MNEWQKFELTICRNAVNLFLKVNIYFCSKVLFLAFHWILFISQCCHIFYFHMFRVFTKWMNLCSGNQISTLILNYFSDTTMINSTFSLVQKKNFPNLKLKAESHVFTILFKIYWKKTNASELIINHQSFEWMTQIWINNLWKCRQSFFESQHLF